MTNPPKNNAEEKFLDKLKRILQIHPDETERGIFAKGGYEKNHKEIRLALLVGQTALDIIRADLAPAAEQTGERDEPVAYECARDWILQKVRGWRDLSIAQWGKSDLPDLPGETNYEAFYAALENIANIHSPRPDAAAVQWECFSDPAYYDLWAVRPVGDKSFSSQRLFHVQSMTEAEALRGVLNGNHAAAVQGETLEQLLAKVPAGFELKYYGQNTWIASIPRKGSMNMNDAEMENTPAEAIAAVLDKIGGGE